jgi:hypothetical protein
MLSAQDEEALKVLCMAYPEFQEAYADGKVGHHFMVARSDALPKAETFELVAASAAHYQALGHAFMVVEATNQWTGAACEVLGATRAHFAPFRAQRTVRQSAEPLLDTVTSPDGFLSNKDSGSMLYVIRLVWAVDSSAAWGLQALCRVCPVRRSSSPRGLASDRPSRTRDRDSGSGPAVRRRRMSRFGPCLAPCALGPWP